MPRKCNKKKSKKRHQRINNIRYINTEDATKFLISPSTNLKYLFNKKQKLLVIK